MLREAFDDFMQASVFVKGFFVVTIAVIVAVGLYHGGVIKIPSARARDCEGKTSARIEILFGATVEPKTVQATVCDVLVFKVTDDRFHEPALGDHPRHAYYPGFDAEEAISAGQQHEVLLNRPGSYSFHDHLYPELEGNIIITE